VWLNSEDDEEEEEEEDEMEELTVDPATNMAANRSS